MIYRILILTFLSLMNLNMNAQDLNIYYFSLLDKNIDNKPIYESEKSLTSEERWRIIKNEDGIEQIQTIVGLNIFDYHLLKLIKLNDKDLPKFKDYIIVKDLVKLIELLDKNLIESVSKNEYCYRIFIPSLGYHYNPYPFKFMGENLKISTIHSTYLTKSENHDKIEVFSYDKNSTKEWLDINTTKLMSYGNIKFRVDKVFYRNEFQKIIMELKALCRIAISIEQEIKVNYY